MDWTVLSKYIGLWILFGSVHSLLAAEGVKSKIKIGRKTYRLIYNLIQVVVFLYVVVQMPSISAVIMKGFSLESNFLFLLLLILGGIIATWGVLSWDLLAFVGLKDEGKDRLNTGGIYALTRHPVYLGSILIFLSAVVVEVTEGTLGWLIGAGGYFVIGSIFEERKLRGLYEDYSEYTQNVGWFLPWRAKHFRYLATNLLNQSV